MFTDPRERFDISEHRNDGEMGKRFRWEFYITNNNEIHFSILKKIIQRYSRKLERQEKIESMQRIE